MLSDIQEGMMHLLQLLLFAILSLHNFVHSFAPTIPVRSVAEVHAVVNGDTTSSEEVDNNKTTAKKEDGAGGTDDDDEQEVVSKEQFASVLEEARAMLSISDMVYAYTGIRRIARESGDEALQAKLKFPQKSGTLVPLIWENLNLYFKTKSGEEISSEDSEFIKNIEKRKDMWGMYLREAANDHGDKYSAVILMGDTEDDARNSCVYGVGVNHMKKRITVWFRGTVVDDGNGRATWGKNFDTTLRLEENPIDDMCDETPTVNVHRGFMKALLGRRRKIVRFLRKYREENPITKDYSLFVTGHSLGGSLATLFGYFLAQEDDITENRPVTIYTFAAPPVGDSDFGKVFTRLENDGKLRHARIYNRDDPIPDSFTLTQYDHVGISIELDKQLGEISESKSFLRKFLRALLQEHKTERTFEYMDMHSSSFDDVSLEQLYHEHQKEGKEMVRRRILGS